MNKIDTSYLRKISDDFGLWQHVIDGEISLKDGYSLDDNLRGILIAHKLEDKELVDTYFEYTKRSFNEESGLFIEFFDAERNPLDTHHNSISYDTQSMARFILAYCIKNSIHREEAQELLSRTRDFDYVAHPHLRPIAYEILMSVQDSNLQSYGQKLINVFKERFNRETKWFEPKLTYANALIPFALADYYNTYDLEDEVLREIIESSFYMLDSLSRIGVIPAPHGNTEWFKFGSTLRDVYGQQPVDAAYMVLSAMQIFDMTQDSKYLEIVEDWFNWFDGNNIFKEKLIDKNSCADGIDINGISRNAGAESTLMYLWAAFDFYNRGK